MSAGETLQELTMQFTGAGTGPPELRLKAIETVPELFQPRGGISERHVSELVKAIKAVGSLDPVTVMVVGNRTILIDGHHRIEAYGAAQWNQPVPVRYFDGSPEDALVAAGEANSKAKLPMDNTDRQNFAWRLVVIGRHSKAAVAKASGISTSQVATMRKVKASLGEQADDYPTWFKARNTASRKDAGEMSEAEIDQWKQQMADRYTDMLAKTFSTRLARDPEIAAMALSAYFGRRLQDVVSELQGFLPEGDEGEF
ncbi:ParB/RepB/Spo0J family partition protein [Mesorhizobium sp. CO1-1-8]|uniref:ParB/RepB/Spo0J family partition protein n=1 Tax=Mesorhizobium sp. CO1-1-8 TaxID=2876631 RepID=UPI001CD135D1|nr:ParB N-terminal domain-containing protein [Mesorhizobium sp. CO1-1-8]MBZ9772898.1 ParB N-terminal domain-containing protein [Mesorhizobium sp. CO1-1-8]